MQIQIRSASGRQEDLTNLLKDECFPVSEKKSEEKTILWMEVRLFYNLEHIMFYTGCDVLLTKENEIIILIVKDEDLDYGKLFESRQSAASISVERD